MRSSHGNILSLRPYQAKALDKVLGAIAKGNKRPAVVLPTGAGKTVVFAHLASRWTRINSGRVLILAHRDELVRQAVAKLHMVAPDLQVGVVKAGQNDTEARVIVASVQTLANLERLDQLKDISLIIVDECHHAAASSYSLVMNRWGVPCVGFTATMSRGDGKSLGDVWADVVFSMDVLDLIADRHLVDVAGHMVTVDGLSLSDVLMRGSDFAPGSLADALATSEAHTFITDAYTKHARTLPGIVFTPDVASAIDMTAAFRRAGYEAATVWGDMLPHNRRVVLDDYEAGRIQILVNCMVLTEGFDSPRAQVAVIARPTTNPGLYSQMVGRVLRTYPGKDRALVLDVVGVSANHTLATLIDLTTNRIPDIKPGESLLQAAARERQRRNPNLSGYVISTKEVDLFRRSKLAWLETYGGIWFVAVPEAYVFLWPDVVPGRYIVGLKSANDPRIRARVMAKDVNLSYAMTWGEQVVVEYLRQLKARDGDAARMWDTKRSAAWRKRPATESQVRLAADHGLDIPLSGTTRGEASEMIDIHKASRLFDRRRKDHE